MISNSRGITTAAAGVLESSVCSPVLLCSIVFQNETVYVHSSVGSLVYNGNTYLGVGTFGGLSTIAESSDTTANGAALTLSGIPTEYLTDCLSFAAGRGTAQVLLGFLVGGALVANPFPLFVGLVDGSQIDVSQESITLSIAVEGRLVDLQRSHGLRYTDSCQRAKYPADASFQFVQFVADVFINWRSK